MKDLKPNSCYRIAYPTGKVKDFRTPGKIPDPVYLTQVELRNKEVVYLADLLIEPWDHFSEIPCDGEFLIF